MAYAGARGQTAAEMQHVFHFTLPPAQLHPAMGALLTSMNAQHNGYQLRVADALWAQQDASFLAELPQARPVRLRRRLSSRQLQSLA